MGRKGRPSPTFSSSRCQPCAVRDNLVILTLVGLIFLTLLPEAVHGLGRRRAAQREQQQEPQEPQLNAKEEAVARKGGGDGGRGRGRGRRGGASSQPHVPTTSSSSGGGGIGGGVRLMPWRRKETETETEKQTGPKDGGAAAAARQRREEESEMMEQHDDSKTSLCQDRNLYHSGTSGTRGRGTIQLPRFLRRLKNDEGTIKSAYMFALLSSLSYWPFQNDPRPGGATAVRLSRKASTARRITRVWSCGARRRGGTIRRRARWVVRGTLSRIWTKFGNVLSEGAMRSSTVRERAEAVFRAALARALPQVAWDYVWLGSSNSSSSNNNNGSSESSRGSGRRGRQALPPPTSSEEDGPEQQPAEQEQPHPSSSPCGDRLDLTRKGSGKLYTFEWYLHNWSEKGPSGVRWHDTDILVATSGFGDEVVLAFAGSDSAQDIVTNAQTFERAAHSGLFGNGTSAQIRGSVHRGFLNAYSRVERGSIIRLGERRRDVLDKRGPLRGLHRRYDRCVADEARAGGGGKNTKKAQQQKEMKGHGDSGLANASTSVPADGPSAVADDVGSYENGSDDDASLRYEKKRGRRDIGEFCSARGERLMTILREITTDALKSGRLVHLAGHSLGGGLANILALDIIINFPTVPISGLRVWTYGAPEIGDEVFYESAATVSPRLRSFLRSGAFRRYVTLSDDCEEDFITNLPSRILSPRKEKLRGWAASLLGGTRGLIVHAAMPQYLFPIDEGRSNDGADISLSAARKVEKKKKKKPKRRQKSNTAVDVHKTTHYLRGLSRLSVDYPLGSDLPRGVAVWCGELT